MTTQVWASTAVLDAELNAIKTAVCVTGGKVVLLADYVIGATQTVIGQSTIASLPFTSGTADATNFSAADFAAIVAGTLANSRKLSFTPLIPKVVIAVPTTGAGASTTPAVSQLAFLDAAGVPAWVATVTSQVITANGTNTVTFPTVSYTANQPTA